MNGKTDRIVQSLAIVAIAFLSPIASAHDARPLSIGIIEQTDGVYRAVVRTPPTVETQNMPRIIWPDPCQLVESTTVRLVPASTILVSCPGGLENQTIRINYPAFNPSITTLIRLQTANSAPITAVLPPDELQWNVPADPGFSSIARDYLMLGFRHIWEGLDHLLFVAGLMLLARQARKILWAVTGFTVAHSITLSLASLGFVRLAVAPVEAMIALSILFLAAEIARDNPTSFSRRYPIVLSFVFGLLHGFGFASALGEIGLPRSELAAGLLFFNLGVELGQIVFIASLALLALGWRLRPSNIDRATGLAPGQLALIGAYCLGIPAAFWVLERTAVAFG